MTKLKKDNLNISMIGHKRIPSREGGIEIVVEELATRMVCRGNKVTCYNRNGHHVSGKEFDIETKKEHLGIQLKNVFTIDKKGLAAMTSSLSAAILASFSKTDVVHFHGEGPSFMCFIPKIFGKKIIVTIHGLDWDRSKWGGFATWYLKQGEKMAVRFADEIIILSRNIQDYFKETYNRETNYIPNAVNKPVIKKPDKIKSEFNLEKDSYILFLARLVPEKGIKYLIKAFKEVNTSKKLVIAGGTSDSNEFVKELYELSNDDDRILFTGFVQGELLDELYSNSYIYVLPSDLEGMPLSLLEAMSYGNCCLISNIPECIEVANDYAISFEKSNILDLKDKLQELCDKVDIVQKYKKESSNYICEKYNWDDIVTQTLNLYWK